MNTKNNILVFLLDLCLVDADFAVSDRKGYVLKNVFTW